jgi:hypothetical protein
MPIRSASAPLLAAVLATACAQSTVPAVDACAIQFGRPNEQTGLTAAQCRPQCDCGGAVFQPPTYDAAFVRSLVEDWEHADPYPPLTSDPYALPAPPDDPPDTVCGVLPTGPSGSRPRAYRLLNYASEVAARAAGASPTHFGHCGVCSTLANLAVYMRENDLTAPVRACGITHPAQADNVACLQALGFDLPCAQVWAYNTANTRTACLTPCLAALGQPYHLPDGRLNECIRCDEAQSGAVFKGAAGRTRRNSGLPNALCRPCSEVRPLVHAY